MPTKAPSSPRKPSPVKARTAEPPSPDQTSQPTAAKSIGGKLGALAALLNRSEGATIAQMVEATGWRDASVRGAMAGGLKARGVVVTSQKADGVRVYRAGATSQ